MKLALRLGALLTAWLVGVAVWIAAGPRENPKANADTAIVLGAAVYTDTPSPVFAARIDHAIALFNEGRVRRIFFTGGRSPEDAISEAAAARDYALAAGVPASAITIEQKSRTTRQNLVEAQRAIAPNQSVLIVSDPLHLRRALMMANGMGFAASASATPTTRYQSLSTQLPFLLREVYFVHHYWLLGE